MNININFFFLFGNPNVRGGGSSRLGQIPNFYQKLVLKALIKRWGKVRGGNDTGRNVKVNFLRNNWSQDTKKIYSEDKIIWRQNYIIIKFVVWMTVKHKIPIIIMRSPISIWMMRELSTGQQRPLQTGDCTSHLTTLSCQVCHTVSHNAHCV